LQPTLKVSGRVADERGRPVAKAEVRASRWAPAASNGQMSMRVAMTVDTVTADREGRFMLRLLPGGRYEFRAAREGCGPAVVPGGGIQTGLDLGTLVVRRPDAAIPGRVKDTEGQPVAGARVSAFGKEQPMAVLEATSGPDGRYRLAGLVPGKVSVSAMH